MTDGVSWYLHMLLGQPAEHEGIVSIRAVAEGNLSTEFHQFSNLRLGDGPIAFLIYWHVSVQNEISPSVLSTVPFNS